MNDNFFVLTSSARKEFYEKFIGMQSAHDSFYIIDESVKEFSGVWALFGKPKNSIDKWFCLQVGQSENVVKEIKSDIILIESELILVREKKYINQFKECIFEYKEMASARELAYNHIYTNYNQLVFICICANNDLSCRKEIESYFAKSTHSLYWRNGGPFADGEQLELSEVCCKVDVKSKIDISTRNNIDDFLEKFSNQ